MSSEPFRPPSLQTLQRALRPLSLLASPVPVGLERVPRSGPVLFVGNHTMYGGLDVFMLGPSNHPRGVKLMSLHQFIGTEIGVSEPEVLASGYCDLGLFGNGAIWRTAGFPDEAEGR